MKNKENLFLYSFGYSNAGIKERKGIGKKVTITAYAEKGWEKQTSFMLYSEHYKDSVCEMRKVKIIMKEIK